MRKTILTAVAFLVGCLTIPVAVVVWPFVVAYHVWKIETRTEFVRRIWGKQRLLNPFQWVKDKDKEKDKENERER